MVKLIEIVPEHQDWLLTLFEISVRLDWEDIATELLERGISVCGRSAAREDALSAAEAACTGDSICSLRLFEKLLDRLELTEPSSSLGIGLFYLLTRDTTLHEDTRGGECWRSFSAEAQTRTSWGPKVIRQLLFV